MPGKVVADASVVAALAFGEGRADEARVLLTDTEIHAPNLLAFELANVAQKHIMRGQGSREAILEALLGTLASPILWSPIDPAAAVRLALSEGLSAYDASYLFLARSLGMPLLTFDERLSRAANRGGQAVTTTPPTPRTPVARTAASRRPSPPSP